MVALEISGDKKCGTRDLRRHEEVGLEISGDMKWWH